MCIWFNLFLQRLPEVNELRNIYNHSHKKRKNSLEGSLDQVLFAAELKLEDTSTHATSEFIKCKH